MCNLKGSLRSSPKLTVCSSCRLHHNRRSHQTTRSLRDHWIRWPRDCLLFHTIVSNLQVTFLHKVTNTSWPRISGTECFAEELLRVATWQQCTICGNVFRRRIPERWVFVWLSPGVFTAPSRCKEGVLKRQRFRGRVCWLRSEIATHSAIRNNKLPEGQCWFDPRNLSRIWSCHLGWWKRDTTRQKINMYSYIRVCIHRGVPRNFVRGGGSTNSVEDRDNRDLEAVAP